MSKSDNTGLIIGAAAAGAALLLFAGGKKVKDDLDSAAEILTSQNLSSESQIINGLHPVARKKFIEFLNVLRKNGYMITLTSGYRSFQKQKKLREQFDRGEIPAAARPGLSYHNYGLAIDINMERAGKQYKLHTLKEDWERTGVPEVARRLGLRWGGTFNDNVHFDYPIATTAVLLEKAKRQFGSVEVARGNEVIIT
jgi:hypothetical protein